MEQEIQLRITALEQAVALHHRNDGIRRFCDVGREENLAVERADVLRTASAFLYWLRAGGTVATIQVTAGEPVDE